MISAEKHARARWLRAEAQHLRRHGFTNSFQHTYACLRYGQLNKARDEDRCGLCPMRPFVPGDYREEAFACQHITEEGWTQAAEQPQLAGKVAAWLLESAAQLERELNRASP